MIDYTPSDSQALIRSTMEKTNKRKNRLIKTLSPSSTTNRPSHNPTTTQFIGIDSNSNAQQPPPKPPRVWKISPQTGSIIGFSLTDCRKDIIYRLKTNQLYTLEECKLLLKEVTKIMKRDAESDLKNLMFLSRYRNEKLYPKPIVSDYLSGEELHGFADSNEDYRLIYGNVKRAQKSTNQQTSDSNDYSRNEDPNTNKHSGNEENSNKHSGNEEAIPDAPHIHQDTQQQDDQISSDSFISMLDSKKKLHTLVWRINQSIVKLIDTSLRQRKERLMLASTILEELESIPQVKDGLLPSSSSSLNVPK